MTQNIQCQILFIAVVNIKIEKEDEPFTKTEAIEPVSEAQHSDNDEIDTKPQRSRSPSQTWTVIQSRWNEEENKIQSARFNFHAAKRSEKKERRRKKYTNI